MILFRKSVFVWCTLQTLACCVASAFARDFILYSVLQFFIAMGQVGRLLQMNQEKILMEDNKRKELKILKSFIYINLLKDRF